MAKLSNAFENAQVSETIDQAGLLLLVTAIIQSCVETSQESGYAKLSHFVILDALILLEVVYLSFSLLNFFYIADVAMT